MAKRNLLIYFLVLTAVFAVFVFSQKTDVKSQGLEAIEYPVAELGNCKSQDACEAFCEKDENIVPCVNFAESHGLMSAEDAAMARKLAEVGITQGPGGCRGQDKCEAYCDKQENIRECITFARDNGLMPPEELVEAEMVIAALDKGAKLPGNCAKKEDCEEYCEDPANLEECIAFAEAAGFITPSEVEMIKKTGGKGPGNCRGKQACDSYCQDPGRMEECINFAIQYDLMPSEEKEDALKMLSALQRGVQPLPCRSKEECDDYCSLPENALGCVNFAEAAGFMTAEEAVTARRMAEKGITGGPGGCRSKEDCESFCDNPDNMVTCVDFAEMAGMMTPEEAAQARKMAELGITGGPGGCKSQEDCESFCADPANGQTCLEFAVRAGMMSQEEADRMMSAGQMMQQGGPGGCKSEEECRGYCDDPAHSEECLEFAQQSGMMSEEDIERAQMIQGKCTGPEDCFLFCQNNPQDSFCQEMVGGEGPEGGMPPSGFPEGGEFHPPEAGELPEGFQPGQQMPPEGMTQPPTQEEMERMIQEQTQLQQQQIQQQMMEQQIQQQIQQQMQQMTPPPTEAPQSFWENTKQFLANIISLFAF